MFGADLVVYFDAKFTKGIKIIWCGLVRKGLPEFTVEASSKVGDFGPGIIAQNRGKGHKCCMIGGAVVVLFQGQDLAFCGLVHIRVIKGGPEGLHKGSPSDKGELPCACIHVGLEPGPCGLREVGLRIGDFTGFCGILGWVLVEY